MAILFYSLSGACLITALLQLRRIRHVRHQIMAFAFFTAAIGFAGYQLLIDGLFLRYPHLFLVMNIFGIIAITSMYYHARWLIDPKFTLAGPAVLTLFAVASVYVALVIPFWYLSGDMKALIIGEILTLKVLYTRNDPQLLGFSVFKLSNGYFALASIVTFALSLRLILPRVQWGVSPRSPEFYAALSYGVCFVTVVLGTVAAIIDSLPLLVVCGVVLGGAIGGIYLVGAMFERKRG